MKRKRRTLQKVQLHRLGTRLCLLTDHLRQMDHALLYAVPLACSPHAPRIQIALFRSSHRNFDEKRPRLKGLKPITEKRKRKLNGT